MPIKYADEIIKERGNIQVKDKCVTGEEFEKWLKSKHGSVKEENAEKINIV